MEHMKGRNRNNPCFCGSGKKYKHCHLGKENEEQAKPYQLANAFNKTKHSECNVPSELKNGCVKKIINAHTVSKSSSLKPIARDGHVYQMKFDLMTLEKTNGKVCAEKIGINKASTFTGFCAKHDKELFSPIEDKPFVWDDEQIFLINYRALVHEIQTKRDVVNAMKSIRPMVDSGRDIRDQIGIQRFLDAFIYGNELGIKDLRKYKDVYDDVLQSKDYSAFEYLGFEFDKPLPIMASGCNAPTNDVFGNKIQSLGEFDSDIGSLFYSSFSFNGKGFFCFIWNSNFNKAPEKFVRSFCKKYVADNKIGADNLLNFLLERCENIYFDHDWWDGLDGKKKRSIETFFQVTKDVEQPYISGLSDVESSNMVTNILLK